MAAEGGALITFIFNGEDREDIPRNVTHLIIHENITVIPARVFFEHPNLVEVYCHAGVTKIEGYALYCCFALRRLIIPGVVVVEGYAVLGCVDLIHVECAKLERIGDRAFKDCESMSSIYLPSAKIVEYCAFSSCPAMTEAIFGKNLESIGLYAFDGCISLESITFPLKNGVLARDIFEGCVNLKRVDLIEGDALCAIADGLLLESWRNDMNNEINSINEILPDTYSGDEYNVGGKAIAIQEWIGSVLRKIIYYKAAHRELLVEAAAVLQLSLPNDTVMNNVLPFIELPSHIVFDGEDEAE